jgi:hypothetical protein
MKSARRKEVAHLHHQERSFPLSIILEIHSGMVLEFASRGDVVAAGWLLVATVNFTNCDTVEQLCSFAGLVPDCRWRARH